MNIRRGVDVVVDRARKKYRNEGLGGLVGATIDDLKFKPTRDVVLPVVLDRHPHVVLTADERPTYARMYGEHYDLGLDERLPVEGETVSDGRIEFASELPSDVRYSHFCPWFTHLSPTVSVLPDANVHGPIPFGVTADGRAVADTITATRRYNRKLETVLARAVIEHGVGYGLRLARGRPLRAESGDERFEHALVLDGIWGRNYGHWMHENVFKLRFCERYEDRTGRRPTLLVRADPPSWMRDHLELLGYGDDVASLPSSAVAVDELVVPTYPQPTPDGIRWLRRRTLDAVSDPRPDLRDCTRIFISRRKASRRQVLNETSVFEMLRSYGFERFVLEELSVAEQATLFSDAEVVVGPAGSGFANAMYAEDPTLIELVGHLAGVDWFRVSKMLGRNHRHLFCERRGRDLIVDVPALERAVEEALA